jgi:lipoprotein signal peptidase
MGILFLTVIIAPLLETFVFQYLIIEILYKLKINDEIIIWVSALAFSLSHYYNFIYILAILFPGFLFSSFYLYLKKSKYKSPFLAVILLHAISNFIVFVINDILNL